MVATRRGAKLAAEAASAPANTSTAPAPVTGAAPNTLDAPPKRGGRKKATVAQAAEPTPAATKTTKATNNKRKAPADPVAAAKPDTKKHVTKPKAEPKKRVTKAKAEPEKQVTKPKAATATKRKTEAEVAPPPAKRAARGRKACDAFPNADSNVAASQSQKNVALAAQDVDTPMTDIDDQESDLGLEQASTLGRTRNAATVNKSTANESTANKSTGNDAPKPASRTRKAKASKAVGASEEGPSDVLAEVFAMAQAMDPNVVAPPLPTTTTRVTRSREIAALPQNFPLKAPARKPTKKASAATQKVNEPVHPSNPSARTSPNPTPSAYMAAPLTTSQALEELPGYPDTPEHIAASISNKDAMAELPDYPKTPAHIAAPITTQAALAALPGYPETPAHIKAPISVQDAMAELPGYPKTPAHIAAPFATQAALAALPDYPETPAHIRAPISVQDAMAELPGYPKTPAHISAPLAHSVGDKAPEKEYPTSSPLPQDPSSRTMSRVGSPQDLKTPTHTHDQGVKDGKILYNAFLDVSTPGNSTPSDMSPMYGVTGTLQTPAQISWGMTNQEAFEELPEEYPITPAHITAPISTQAALAEMPSYPDTPALAVTATVQAESTTSTKKYRSSPLKNSVLDVTTPIQAESTAAANKHRSSPFNMFSTPEDLTEYSEFDTMEIDSEGPAAESTPHPSRLVNPYADVMDPVSPKKSSMRSPERDTAQSAKKAVTWVERDNADLMWEGPIKGTVFYLDLQSDGKSPNWLYAGLLEDLGARVVQSWDEAAVTHVLFKNGSNATLEKVRESNGEIKCVTTGWAIACEAQGTRVDEGPFLVDLSTKMASSPLPEKVCKTPAQTPSRWALAPSSAPSYPATPTSSEWERSFTVEEGAGEKENGEEEEEAEREEQMVRSAPPKKTSSLRSRSPKTPSKASSLGKSPVRPVTVGPASKKRSADEASLLSQTPLGSPKKFRLSE